MRHEAPALSVADDPDAQGPLPLLAAVDYARTVMGWSRGPLPDDIDVVLDQPYGEHRLQRFDLFAPRGATSAPVLVFWHGGGWTNGYRQWVRFMAPHIVGAGAILVAPSYRLAPRDPFPAAIDDALAVFAHLLQQRGRWGGASGRFVLSGHSAGGHLAAMVALRHASASVRGAEHANVLACMPISGIMDLHAAHPATGSLEERVYTQVLRGQGDELDVVMSPLYWTAGHRIPFDLSVGEHDSARVLRSNRRLHAMLQAQSVSASLHAQVGRDHFQTHLDMNDGQHPWYRRLATWLHSTR